MKYFYENASECHIIGAGSLFGVTIHPEEWFAIGKVDFMKLILMSFHKFLDAMDELGIAELAEEITRLDEGPRARYP